MCALQLSPVPHSQPPLSAASLSPAVVGCIQCHLPDVFFTFTASFLLPAPYSSLLWLLDDENTFWSLGCSLWALIYLVLLGQIHQRAGPPLGSLWGSAGKMLPFSALFKPKGSWLGSVASHLQRDLGRLTPVSAGEVCGFIHGGAMHWGVLKDREMPSITSGLRCQANPM